MSASPQISINAMHSMNPTIRYAERQAPGFPGQSVERARQTVWRPVSRDVQSCHCASRGEISMTELAAIAAQRALRARTNSGDVAVRVTIFSPVGAGEN